MPEQDAVAARLVKAPVPNNVRADAWDAFQQASDVDDLAKRLSTIQIPDDVKSDLWDMKRTALQPAVSQPEKPSDSGALAARGMAAGIAPAATLATDVATNPGLPAAAGFLARGVTQIGALGHGLVTGNMSEVIASPMEAWAAGKGGYFLGRGAQTLAAPVAKALNTLAPYAQAISTVSGAQGVLDLAQMADKTRTDIGTLGVSLGPVRSDAEKAANPTLVTATVNLIKKLSSALEANGVPAPDAHAVKLISADNPSLFGRLMTWMQGQSK